MTTKVHRPTEAKASGKAMSESNLIRPSRQDQLKINSYFREARQKIRSEVEDIEHRIKVSLPEFESYEHTIHLGSEPEPDCWFLLCVQIEIPPYAIFGVFGITHTWQVQTLREPYPTSSGRGARDKGILGVSKQELDALGLWLAGKKNSLMNPSQHVVVSSKVQALAWYCRWLALREFLQQLDLRMEKQLTQAVEGLSKEDQVVAASAPRTLPAGRPRNKDIVERDNLIASLRQNYGGLARNKKIARSLDEQSFRPPPSWDVDTFYEATESRKWSRKFACIVAKAKFKKVPTP